MFDSLSAMKRLLLCLLFSSGLHGGLVFSDWGETALLPRAALIPLEVSRVEIVVPAQPAPLSSRVLPAPAESPSPSSRSEATPAAVTRPSRTWKTQAVKSAEPLRHAVPDRAAPQVPQPSEQQVCMVAQDLLTGVPLAADDPGSAGLTPAATPLPAAAALSAAPVAAPLVEATPVYSSNPLPEYPSLARQRRWEGVVWLQVEVTAEGLVSDVQVEDSSGHKLLDRSASRAVGRWRFVPATRGGLPVDCRVRVPVRFRLEEG